ncbi:MAG: hypothetical protein R3E31_10870 [Chloroflexota bacterium]
MKSRVEVTILFLLVFVLMSACTATTGNEPSANELLDTKPDMPLADTAVPSTLTPGTNEDTAVAAESDTTTNLAAIQGMQIMLLESFPVQVNVAIFGMLPDGCTSLGAIDIEQNGNTFDITVHTVRPKGMMCTQVVSEFEESISLDVVGLKAGTYTVNVNGMSDTFTLDVDNGSANEEASELSEVDLQELLRQTLTMALVDQSIPDYGLLAGQPNIVLSNEGIDPDMLPTLPGVDLVVMSPAEIQKQADEDGDFLYLRFDEITAVSATTARVSLSSFWAVAKTSDMLYLSGGGFAVEFTRTADGWQGEISLQWIS